MASANLPTKQEILECILTCIIKITERFDISIAKLKIYPKSIARLTQFKINKYDIDKIETMKNALKTAGLLADIYGIANVAENAENAELADIGKSAVDTVSHAITYANTYKIEKKIVFDAESAKNKGTVSLEEACEILFHAYHCYFYTVR